MTPSDLYIFFIMDFVVGSELIPFTESFSFFLVVGSRSTLSIFKQIVKSLHWSPRLFCRSRAGESWEST